MILATICFILAIPFGAVAWMFTQIATGFIDLGEYIDVSVSICHIKKR